MTCGAGSITFGQKPTDIPGLGANRMQPRNGHDYIFGRFYLNTRERVLLSDGKPVPITLKAFATLLVLVQSSGHLVERVELMKQVWPNAFVEDANLTQHIYKLRKILGGADGHKYIETVPRRGYRFTGATSKSRREGDGFMMQHRSENVTSIPERDAITSLETTTISLAIVPFVFASVEPDADSLRYCITESLTSILSGLPQLRIMSRNIVFAVQK